MIGYSLRLGLGFRIILQLRSGSEGRYPGGCYTFVHRRKLLLGPGAQAPPPLLWSWGSHIWRAPHFCDVILSKLCFNCLHWFYAMLTVIPFIPCSARHFKKGAKFAGSVGHLMTKMLSVPDPLTRGSAPEPRWGLCSQTPVIGSCSTLAMVPPTPSAAYHPRASSPPTYFDKFTPMIVRQVLNLT